MRIQDIRGTLTVRCIPPAVIHQTSNNNKQSRPKLQNQSLHMRNECIMQNQLRHKTSSYIRTISTLCDQAGSRDRLNKQKTLNCECNMQGLLLSPKKCVRLDTVFDQEKWFNTDTVQDTSRLSDKEAQAKNGKIKRKK